MKNPHIVNLIYSLLLLVTGIAGFMLRYAESGDFQYTALIPALFGIILLSMGQGIKRENKIVSHLAVLLTLTLAVFALVMIIVNSGDGMLLTRKGIIFMIILSSSLIVLGIYILRFIRIKQGS